MSWLKFVNGSTNIKHLEAELPPTTIFMRMAKQKKLL
jgi:hypothetical protein